MKKIASVALIAVMALSLAACAQSGSKQIKVKCPACGYEFLAPADN